MKPKDVRCPRCFANPGQQCTNDDGDRLQKLHGSRIAAAADAPETRIAKLERQNEELVARLLDIENHLTDFNGYAPLRRS